MFLLDGKISKTQEKILNLQFQLNDQSPMGVAKRELLKEEINNNELLKLERQLEFLKDKRNNLWSKVVLDTLVAVPSYLLGLLGDYLKTYL